MLCNVNYKKKTLQKAKELTEQNKKPSKAKRK